MLKSLRISLFLISELLGSLVIAVPLSHQWAKFKNPEGKTVLVNFHNINSASSGFEEISTNNVQFHLYTKINPTKSQRLYINDTRSLISSNYDTKLQTKFIVHGFLGDLNSETIQGIKNNFLVQSLTGYNIIAVDWSHYTTVYSDVLNKSKGVGNIIGDMVDFLVSQGTQLKNLHLIGHSLGAHACGFAGTSMKSGKVARITGLDPALPGFDGVNQTDRLDSQDANFVDCIHTCGGFLGIDDPICTADFYPNSGKDQPGCHWFDFGSCSHARSHEYFAESIIKGHNFPSLTCLSLHFNQEECIDKGALMGYPAIEEYTGIFFVETNDDYPFAMNITSVK